MKNISYALLALLTFSGCGKALHLSLKSQAAVPGGSIKVVESTPTPTPSQSSVSLFDGQLIPISRFDSDALTGKLPFLNLDDMANSVRTLKSPAFEETINKQLVGYVKRSNLVFRAIIQVPPKEAITKIDSLRLEIKGLRRFNEKGVNGDDLSKQVLCIADTRICSGEKADETPAEKANLNPAFWTDAKVTNEVFSTIKTGKILFNNPVTGESLSAVSAEAATGFSEGDQLLDLRVVFGLEKLSTSELVDWIYANSTEYAEPGYRKFRFVMGNNLYFDEGQIVLQVEKDDRRMPGDFAQAPGHILNGDRDAADVQMEPAVPSVLGVPGPRTDLEVALIFDKLHFQTGSVAISERDAARIRSTGLLLSKKAAQFEQLRIIGQTDEIGSVARNLELSRIRAGKVKTILKSSGVPAEIMKSIGLGEVKSSMCQPWELCPWDRMITLQFEVKHSLSRADKELLTEGLKRTLKKIWN
jgi:outer membrane protein OmpA-like peptidoglycan-associated protein